MKTSDSFIAQETSARRRAWLLKCKVARKYIIDHPGCTNSELRRATGANDAMVKWLIMKGFVHSNESMGLEVTPM